MTSDDQRSWRDITRVVTVPLSVIGTNRITMWVVFRGRRSMVSIALLGAVFVAFTSLALVRPLDTQQLLSDTRRSERCSRRY